MSLKAKAVKNTKWTAFSTVVVTLSQIIQLTVLARLLAPDEFGLMAMVMVVIGFTQNYADLGLAFAVIQKQDTDQKQLSTLYWLNLIVGIALFSVLFLFSPVIALLFHEPRISAILQWVSSVFLIVSIGQLYQVLLQKQLRFDILALAETSGAIVGCLAGLFLALAGQGVMALVYAYLATAVIKTSIMSVWGARGWRPDFHFRYSDLKDFLNFGAYQVGERSVNYFGERFDQLIIGYLLGAHALGLYSLAFNVVISPIGKINPVITRVAFPIFARVQDDNNKLLRGYFFVLNFLNLINYPLLLGVVATASTFVPLAFGDNWKETVAIIQVLAWVAVFRSSGNTVGSLILAKGRADLGFKWNVIMLFIHIICILVGAHFGGLIGVAISLLFVQVACFYPAYKYLIVRSIGHCFQKYVFSIVPAMLLSCCMAGIVVLLTYALKGLIESPALLLGIQVLTGSLSYLLMIAVFQKKQLKDILESYNTMV